MFRVDLHHKVGEWTPAGGLNISDKYAFSHGRPPNITLRVMSRIEHPFVMKTTAKDGNDRFEVSALLVVTFERFNVQQGMNLF